jgi:hypothetical protein
MMLNIKFRSISVISVATLIISRNINARNSDDNVRNFYINDTIQFLPQLSFTSTEFSDKSASLFAGSSSDQPWYGQMNIECKETLSPLCSWHIQAGQVSRFVIKNLSRVPFVTIDPPGK